MLRAALWIRGLDPRGPPAQRLRRLEGQNARRAHEAVVESLGQNDVDEQLGQTRWIVEQLEKPEAKEPFRDREEQQTRDLHQRMTDPELPGQEANHEACQGSRESLNAEKTAAHRVLKES